MGNKMERSKAKIKLGTNRLCIVGKKYTYKFPLFFRGYCANKAEYSNYLNNKDIVAYTEKHWWGLKQETLTNTVIYKLDEKDILPEHQSLVPYALKNRMQVGKSKDGAWKFFDYEDVKYYKQLNKEIVRHE